MKSKVISFIALLICLPTLTGISVSASSKPAGMSISRLSYGVDVISQGIEMKKSVKAGECLGFNPKDFEDALGLDKLSSITVLSLPDDSLGKLTLSGVSVMKNQIIARESIYRLKFDSCKGKGGECSFVVGAMNDGSPLTLKCVISVECGGENSGKENLSVSTIEEISCYSNLSANGADDVYCYIVTAYPEKGTLDMIDAHSGHYRYTPIEGFTGEDSFEYIAVGTSGQRSEPVTVDINVRKNDTGVFYCDMKDEKAHLAAMILAERGIMVGRTVCGVGYFEPDEGVRRDEFLAMAMNMAGVTLGYDPDAKTTFADDQSIPSYLKSYVSYAEDAGYINGVYSPDGNKFSPAKGITAAEASVMMYNVLGLTPGGEAEEVFADNGSVPVWAVEAMAAMVSRGVIPLSAAGVYSEPITRAQAAEMLVAMSGLVNGQ